MRARVPTSFAPREMHDADCSDCHQKTQVPFKPTAGRPVYCRDCFQNHKTDRPTREE